MTTEKRIYTDEELNNMTIEELQNLFNSTNDLELKRRIEEIIKRKKEKILNPPQRKPKREEDEIEL